ncbi:hypothetical protein SSX86_022143 [Deinandra increscens subsp. villosa]|uniref:Pre-mRNA-splicing factor 18 n=1 Tax=Deinandra increscens subsp. villosa TaxID=3103831 RepID=A0AAP0CQ16_9ASTR
MDILKQELLKKRQSLSEETGGRKVFKRSEIEQKRIQKIREEENRDAEAKRLRQNPNQNESNSSDPNSSSNPNSKLDSTKSKPESGAGSSSKAPISDEQKIDALNLPKPEVLRRLRFLKQPVTLFGESDDDRLDRLKYVLKTGLFELDDSDMTEGQTNDFLRDIVELKKRQRSGLTSDRKRRATEESTEDKDGGGGEDDVSGDGGSSGMDQDKDFKRMKANFSELCDEDKILVFFKKLLIEWNQELDEMSELEKRTAKGKSTFATFKQCARYLNPLFKFCRKKVLPDDIRQALMLVVNCCMKRDYLAAMDHYIRMAIGNAPWPIGVTMVGIHERSAREKIYTNSVAHVMNDETTRKYLQSVKRLMTFCQRRYPTMPSKAVEFNSLANGSDLQALLAEERRNAAGIQQEDMLMLMPAPKDRLSWKGHDTYTYTIISTRVTLFLPHPYSSLCKPPMAMDSLLSPSLPKRPKSPSDHFAMDALLTSFLALSDAPSPSIHTSFDRLIQSTPSDSDQNRLIQRALHLGSLLLEAGNRSARRCSSSHNAVVWPLSPDLTIKIFSMLDTQSVCYVAATCSFFQKCTMDPMCYANIDLATLVPKVNNAVVSTMINRAGDALKSIKLGVLPPILAPPFFSSQPLVYSIRNANDASGFSWNDKRSRQGKESSILTRSCLNSLSGNGGSPGIHLRRLHLYNIERMDNASLLTSLSACPSLLDLEIVGLHVELRNTLESVSRNCPLIERLVFESSKTGRDDGLKFPTCNEFVFNCPNITTLALKGFKLHDYKARMLVKGLRRLKHLDLSTSYSFTGAFLKNVSGHGGGDNLEVVVLRDCMHLKEIEVERFMTAVLAGEFRLLRHLDISNREGLACEGDWSTRCYNASFIPLEQLLEQRPDFCLVAEFPKGSYIDNDQMTGSDVSLPSQSSSSHTSDGSSTSDGSYNSDHGSGNEYGRENGFGIYDENSDYLMS